MYGYPHFWVEGGSKRRGQAPTLTRQRSGGTLPLCLTPIPPKGNEMQPQPTHSTSRFFLHYLEMVAAMFIGMFALSKPADLLFSALGASTSSQHPAMMLFSMGVTMTVPMIAWMRFRGHA